ncbi:MAG: S41 family peptidase [Tepidisphaeraceae bacterium]
MTKPVLRWTLMAAVCTAMVMMPATRGLHAQEQAPTPATVTPAIPAPATVAPAASITAEQVAAIEQLKLDAFHALKSGKFEQSNELLGKAALMSQDPTVQQMAGWIKQFETQRQVFATERHKQYDKAVADVKKLIENHKESYALDAAARASLLADDKKAFRAEPWVETLVKQTIVMAEEYDKNEQWLKAMRLYADLSAIEPGNPQWKDKLKLATRRIRLLALYTPGGIRALQESESKEREEVDALLNPTTQPATAKAKKDDDEQNDAFRIDWRETVKGIRDGMLIDALKNARSNYFRPVEYKDLLAGGIKGLRALATTKGLEQTFPGLGDPAKRDKFVALLDERMLEAQQAGTGPGVVDGMISRIRGDIDATIEIEEPVWLSEFADGAFAELDPFSSMIWPSDLEEFNKTTQGEFSGVGIQIQLDEDGGLKVVSPLEDSPAYKAGIKAGDVISRINGKNAKGITLNQAVKTITGPSGSTVTLTVRSPGGQVKDYDIKRETIKVASVKGWLHRPGGGWDYFVDAENKIAYLRMTNFTKSTSDELNKAADELRKSGAKGMILDLRYNPGGLLSAATEVTDKFLHDGLIVKTEAERRDTPNQPTFAQAHADDDELALPLVVLVNQYSASASEIVSGALKDQNRARVVGERTFGKGSVQMLFPLATRQAYLKLTTSHYYLPNGKCIHREENSTEWGVDPDLTIEMTPEQMRAAIDARQELDVLRDASVPDAPAEGKQEGLKQEAAEVKEAVAKATKDPMASDPQLSAALLILRMQLAGAQL